MMSLQQKYPDEVAAILARYPADNKRSAVMPLLYLAQRAENYVPAAALDEVAALCEIAPTQVASIVGFTRCITTSRAAGTAFKFVQTCRVPCAELTISLPNCARIWAWRWAAPPQMAR